VAGTSFSNTVTALDEFHPGRLVSPGDLQPFTVALDRFSASYVTSGPLLGQPSSFNAAIRYSATPQAPARGYTLTVNHPLVVDGVRVFLIGHGYAPTFRVTDGTGHVVFDGPVPFVPVETSGLTSEGAIKVPDARVESLTAFYKPRKKTHAEMRFVDVPGPRGKGSGLDAESIKALGDADAFCLVLRAFPGGDGSPADTLQQLRDFDAEHRFQVGALEAREPAECISGQILRGLKKPHDCPAFGGRCTPATPLGATMVSSEGACAAYYAYGRRERHMIQAP